MHQLPITTLSTVALRPAAVKVAGFFLLKTQQTMSENETSSTSLDKSAADFRASVAEEFKKGSARMARIEASLEHTAKATDANAVSIGENTAAMKCMAAQNAEMYELFSAMKGGFKVLEWLGRLAKWAAAIVAGGAAMAKVLGWEWPFK